MTRTRPLIDRWLDLPRRRVLPLGVILFPVNGAILITIASYHRSFLPDPLERLDVLTTVLWSNALGSVMPFALFGWPVWALTHFALSRHWLALAACGGVVGLILLPGPAFWLSLEFRLRDVLIHAGAGAAAGLFLWLGSYRRVTRDDPSGVFE